MRLTNEKDCKIGKIIRIESDYGMEFENSIFANFYGEHGIFHEFSTPKTPQQNGIVERKNRTLQEMARTMLHAKKVQKKFWVEAISTACHLINRVYI